MANKKEIIEELYYRAYQTFFEQVQHEREDVEAAVGPITDAQWEKYTTEWVEMLLKKSGYVFE